MMDGRVSATAGDARRALVLHDRPLVASTIWRRLIWAGAPRRPGGRTGRPPATPDARWVTTMARGEHLVGREGRRDGAPAEMTDGHDASVSRQHTHLVPSAAPSVRVAGRLREC